MKELSMHMAARVMLFKGESDNVEVDRIVVLDVCDEDDEEIELGFDIPRTKNRVYLKVKKSDLRPHVAEAES